MNKGDRVAVIPIGLPLGTVTNVRHDDRGVPILTITLDDDTDVADGLYVAREWEVLSDFQWRMLNLDCALTGNSARTVVQQMHHKPKTPVEWFTRGREWYLSDGGYSRVWIDDTDGHLFLGGNSLDGPKAAWGRCPELIADIEAIVKLALEAAR